MPRLSFKFTSVPDRRLRAMRQTAGTLYHQLLAQGFTALDIAAEAEGGDRVGTRRIGLILASQEGSTVPVVGVSYGGDYRTEEEVGIPQIAKALNEGDHKDRVVTGTVKGCWYLGIHADGGRQWNSSEAIVGRADEAWRRSQSEAARSTWRDEELKAAELREALKDKGISPLPRRKDELLVLYREHVRPTPAFISVGEFSYGDTLIMLPATPVLEAALRILSDAGKHLRMGGSSSPFGRGAALFDDRDLTGETIEARRAREDYVRLMKKKAAPVWKVLEAKGHVFAISPRHRKDGEDWFWLNYSPRGHRQVFGLFTLKQLLERHATGDWGRTA